MSQRLARFVVAIPLVGVPALVVFSLIGAPRTMAGDPCYHGFEIPPRSEAAETQIRVAPCAFAPTVAHLAVGGTVTFFNGPGFTHLITGANAEWGSRDVELQPGQTVSYRFDRPGIYPYACAIHRGMSGAIVVGDSGGSAAAEDASAATSDPERRSGGEASAGSPGSLSATNILTVGAGTLAGLFVGAGGLWFATRRRKE